MNERNQLLQVFANIAGSYGSLLSLLEAVAFILGVMSAFFTVILMYRAGDVQNRGREQGMAWFWSLLVSVLMFTLPGFINAGARQIFGDKAEANPLAYVTTTSSGPLLAPLAGALILLGFFFSMRGLWVLRSVGVHGNHVHGASFGKGMTMIVAGILLVNLKPFLSVVASVTGLNVGAGLFH